MENSELELNTFSLEEKEKVATSLEDIYGYQILSEEFENQVDKYNELKMQEKRQYVEYVFSESKNDEIIPAFHSVMDAQTTMIVGMEYSNDTATKDSPVVVVGFALVGALIAGVILTLIEKRRKGKNR